MTSSLNDLYDANQPSDGLTLDTTGGPVDMVAVLRRLNGEKGLRLTHPERVMVDALKLRYRGLHSAGGPRKLNRTEAYRRLARSLTDAA